MYHQIVADGCRCMICIAVSAGMAAAIVHSDINAEIAAAPGPLIWIPAGQQRDAANAGQSFAIDTFSMRDPEGGQIHGFCTGCQTHPRSCGDLAHLPASIRISSLVGGRIPSSRAVRFRWL